MKFLVVLLAVVLFVPGAAYAQDEKALNVEIDIIGQITEWPTKGDGWTFPHSSMLGVETHDNLEDVSVHIEFSTVTSKHHPRNLDAFQAGRCEVFLVTEEAGTPQIFPKRDGQDLDLWMPYFEGDRRDRADWLEGPKGKTVLVDVLNDSKPRWPEKSPVGRSLSQGGTQSRALEAIGQLGRDRRLSNSKRPVGLCV